MEILSGWKFLLVSYIVITGFWGFFLKIVLNKLDWITTMLYAWSAFFAVYLVMLIKGVKPAWSRYHALALVTGAIGALSGIVFYKMLALKPASIVVPLSSQYILVTALLCFLFLKEPLTVRAVIGIAFSIISVILLSES